MDEIIDMTKALYNSRMTNVLLVRSKSDSKFNFSTKFINEKTQCLINCNVELNNIEFNATVYQLPCKERHAWYW